MPVLADGVCQQDFWPLRLNEDGGERGSLVAHTLGRSTACRPGRLDRTRSSVLDELIGARDTAGLVLPGGIGLGRKGSAWQRGTFVCSGSTTSDGSEDDEISRVLQ